MGTNSYPSYKRMEAAGDPWSVRLKALLSAWMPWIRKRFKLSPEMEKQLLSISPRQMDRRLAAKKTTGNSNEFTGWRTGG